MKRVQDRRDQDAANWRDWTNLLGRVRLGKQKVNGKVITGFTVKAVAERLATYADHRNGTRIRPGVARLAVDLETSYTTVRNALTVLERVGLIRLLAPGNKNRPAVYRLAIGEELMELVEVWSPAKHTLEVEREAEKYRSPAARSTDATSVSGNPVPPTPQESVETPDDLRTTDAVGMENHEPLTPWGVFPLTPTASAHQPVISHKSDQAKSRDVRTELAVVRASRPQSPKSPAAGADSPSGGEAPIGSSPAPRVDNLGAVVFISASSSESPPPDAAIPSAVAMREPCPHGNSSRKRRDGKPRCDQCRDALETEAAIADVQLSPAKCEHGLKNATNARGEVACFACRRGIPA